LHLQTLSTGVVLATAVGRFGWSRLQDLQICTVSRISLPARRSQSAGPEVGEGGLHKRMPKFCSTIGLFLMPRW
jgi:hypothetical protein